MKITIGLRVHYRVIEEEGSLSPILVSPSSAVTASVLTGQSMVCLWRIGAQLRGMARLVRRWISKKEQKWWIT